MYINDFLFLKMLSKCHDAEQFHQIFSPKPYLCITLQNSKELST